MKQMLLLIFALLSGGLSAQTYNISPYGAKSISLAEGGRAFVSGYDAIMINPAGTSLTDEPQFGVGSAFGDYASVSIGYVSESGFHIFQSFRDMDRKLTVGGAQTYAGFSYALSGLWLVGFNAGYNYFQTHNGFDVNFGLDFGPGLKSATRTGFIGAIAIRNPFQNGGNGEVSGTLGYSYKSTFSITLDNIYVFQDGVVSGLNIIGQDRYDMVFALESYPLESEDFSMTFSTRIEDFGSDDNVKVGGGVGYVGDTFKFDTGIYATDFTRGRIRKMIFAVSLIFGV